MAVPSTIADLSTTAASNSPAGSESIGTSLDDYLRAIQAIIKNADSKGSDIASASSITIPSNGFYFVVTGTTGITSIADKYNGAFTVLKFNGAVTLTHSSGLILPGSANITTAAGDVLAFVNESTGVWRCVFYQPVTSPYLTSSAIGVTVQGYDADTAKLDVDQNWTGAQRSAATTDNDGSFDLAAANNFVSTPTAGYTLTFTNISGQSGQSGFIKLVNGSNYAIAAHANTKILAADLTKISATGDYILSYFNDGTNVYVIASGNLA